MNWINDATMFAQANLGRSVAECRIFATKEQLMTYLLGALLKNINFPPKFVVAASGKDPSNCTLGSPNKVRTLRMTQ